MVMLSVASLAALLAMRNLWVNDQLLNAEADQLRTQQQAEAVLPLALEDILGYATTPLRHTMGTPTDTHVFFPNTQTEYNVLQQRLGATNCQEGICAPTSTAASSLQKASDWKTRTQTAMAIGAANSPYGANTAWYWVEVYQEENTGAFVYRITALAQGVSPGSTSAVQAIWKRDSPTSNTGHWLSWHVLRD
jgi:Tfp pilus assembly protein PilX